MRKKEDVVPFFEGEIIILQEFTIKNVGSQEEKKHTDHLQQVIANRGYTVDNDKIIIKNASFEQEVDHIIELVKKRQPRAGRSIFLLDQTGFSQVPLSLVAKIFNRLPAAEVILTFAADALVNHLVENPQCVKMVAPLQLNDKMIENLIQMRGGMGGRALIQRTLLNQIMSTCSVSYCTPFFIRPRKSRRALWIIHLSKHPIARDVMIQQHWKNNNTFEHYGSGDLNMLGWDALIEDGSIPLFNFEEIDRQNMRDQLLESLAPELHNLASFEPVTVEAIRNQISNQTAAQFSDLDWCILALAKEGEFKILNSEGKIRSNSVTKLLPKDQVAATGLQAFQWITSG